MGFLFHVYVFYRLNQQVELVEGYGMYASKRQLDEAVGQSCNSDHLFHAISPGILQLRRHQEIPSIEL